VIKADATRKQQRPSPKKIGKVHSQDHGSFVPGCMLVLTAKQTILTADPSAKLDFYELLRAQKKPCWFIRRGVPGSGVLPGQILSDISSSPKAAWKNAREKFFEAMRKARRVA
jgi:hypothetical protein